MSTADYTLVIALSLVIGVFPVYPAVRFLWKPLLRFLIRYDGKVTEGELAFYRIATRAAPPVFGYLLGRFPVLTEWVLGAGGLYPEWVPPVWVTICSAAGGGFAIVTHHTVEKYLPSGIARFVTGKSISDTVTSGAPQPPPEDTLTTRDAIPTLTDEE